MEKTLKKILSHCSLNYSKMGEDGVLSFMLSQMPDRSGWCVELGAWDGISESNTYLLISQQDYRGIMIEANPVRFKILQENMKSFEVYCVNTFVRPAGDCRLDAILRSAPIPIQFDLLSIDVDGDDYLIWESLQLYRPKIVIIEISPRDRPGVRRINNTLPSMTAAQRCSKTVATFGISGYTGTSITSMTELAARKGYSLVANIEYNAIYVSSEYLGLFHETEVNPSDVFAYEAFGIMELTLRELISLGVRRLFNKIKNNIKLPRWASPDISAI